MQAYLAASNIRPLSRRQKKKKKKRRQTHNPADSGTGAEVPQQHCRPSMLVRTELLIHLTPLYSSGRGGYVANARF